MPKYLIPCLAALLLAASAHAQNPRVWLDTDQGAILLELDAVNAPVTTQNFLDYVNDGFYDGLMFHRTVADFVIQSGGFDRNFAFRQPTRAAIGSEAGNGLANEPGAIAMALSGGNVNSGRTQFYINVANNTHLDADFTVFGKVIGGMSTVDAISQLRTGTMGLSSTEVQSQTPVSPPLIHRAVAYNGQFPVMPLHTGSWFEPGNGGVGFNIEVANDASTEQGPVMVVYWYDFNQGQPLWLTGVTSFEYGATEVTMDLIAYPGDDPAVDFQMPPSGSAFEVWGSLSVRFDDCRTGRFNYDSPEFGQGEIVAARLTIPDRASCEDL